MHRGAPAIHKDVIRRLLYSLRHELCISRLGEGAGSQRRQLSSTLSASALKVTQTFVLRNLKFNKGLADRYGVNLGTQ